LPRLMNRILALLADYCAVDTVLRYGFFACRIAISPAINANINRYSPTRRVLRCSCHRIMVWFWITFMLRRSILVTLT